MSERLILQNEAVARRTRRALADQPAGSLVAASSQENQASAGIHAAVTSLHTQQSEKIPSGRKGLGGGIPARQGRSDLWRDEEINELRQLVSTNTGPNGNVSWVKVEEIWKTLNLGERSKASLTAKWRSIKIDGAIGKTLNDQKGAQNSTEKATPIKKKKDSSTSVTTDKPGDSVTNKNTAGDRNIVSKDTTDGTAAAAVDPLIMKTFKKNLEFSKKIGCKPNGRKPPYRISDRGIQPLISGVDRLIERELGSKVGSQLSWTHLSVLVYAGALTVVEMGDGKRLERKKRTEEWFKSSNREVQKLRAIIGKATAELNRQKVNSMPTSLQIKNLRMLKKNYGVEMFIEIKSLAERLTERLKLLRSRIAQRLADERRIRARLQPLRVLFRDTDTSTDKGNIDIHSVRKYWKGIVGSSKSFDHKDADLVAWAASLKHVKAADNLHDCLNLDVWQAATRKAKPWKAHGPDGLQGFWWKAFKSANASLFHLARHHLTTGSPLPEKWISEGRIILLHKSGPLNDPSNFRPIACLNTCYKLVTSFISMYVEQHARRNNILPPEQIALQKGVWGCTHALILDQTVVADAKYQRQRPISLAWIDYAKAFDSVPHDYIKWVMRVVSLPQPIRKFVSSLMDSWKVRYEAKDSSGRTLRSQQLKIKSGVLQGDSFSPLLFCIAMAPISYALNKTNIGYTTTAGKSKRLQMTLSHLFYMDDLKLYADSRENLMKLIEKVESISAAISMNLNTKKCAKAHFDPDCSPNVQGSGPPAGDGVSKIPALEGGATYKYLGIEQTIGLEEHDAWDRATEKCSAVAKIIWESDLTFRQKVNSYNMKVAPVLKYVVMNTVKGSGKYACVLKDGGDFDKKIRRLMVALKVRYKASCVDRLYLAAELGGYGLKSVKDSLQEATIYSWAYLCTREDLRSPLNLFAAMSNRGKRSVISDAGNVLKTYNIEANLDRTDWTVTVSGITFNDARTLARYVVGKMRSDNNTKRNRMWKELELSGRVLRATDSIDVEKSFAWLRAGKLSSTAVRNVIAAQEGCLITRTHPSKKNAGRTTCRACGKTPETIEHVISSCPKWLTTIYIDRHDSVARNIYYRVCEKYKLKPPHYSQRVESVVENNQVKLYWGQPIQTKAIVRHNKPDIVIFDKISRKCTVIEVAVSWFTGIARQTNIKTNRYCVNGNWEEELKMPYPRGDNLIKELRSSGWSTDFLPVVVGACGEVLEGLVDRLVEHLQISKRRAEDCIERMERSAVLGTSRIIQNHLSLGTD
jgi:hypothetical protein